QNAYTLRASDGVQAWNPAGATAPAHPNVTTALEAAAVTVLNGNVLVLGGELSPEPAQNVTDTAYSFNGAAWSTLTAMPVKTGFFPAVTVGGTVYTFGGIQDVGLGVFVSNVVQTFDGTTWGTADPMPGVR